MRSNIPKPLADHLDRLGLVLADVAPRAASWVAKRGKDIPPFESLWIDALHCTGAITAFQAAMLQRGQGATLRIGPYVLVSEARRLNGRPSFLARRIDQPGDYELIVIECRDQREAERLSLSAAALAEAARCWQREHTWPAVDRAAPVIDAGADECRFYAAIPHIEGRSLAELITGRGKFDGLLASVIARPLLLLLAELEEAGLGARVITPDHVRFTRQGGVVVVAPGLLDLLAAEESLLPPPAGRAAGDSLSDSPGFAPREAPAETADWPAAARRRACGTLLKKIACGAVGGGTADGDSSLSKRATALAEVVDCLMAPSGDCTFRQLADRLPRSDDAARRTAARHAYRPIAIQRQWLQACGHFNQYQLELRRMMRPLLWCLVIGALLSGGWWAAGLRSSVSHRTAQRTSEATPTSIAGVRREGDASRGAIAPAAPTAAAEPAVATGSAPSEQKPDSFLVSNRSVESHGLPESPTVEERARRNSMAGTAAGTPRRPAGGGAEGPSRAGNVRPGGRGDGLSPPNVRQVQFEEGRKAGPSVVRPEQSPLPRPADLVIDSRIPVATDRLRLRDGQRVRAAPGRRATIAVPDAGWRLSAEGVIFEHIDFTVSRPANAGQNGEAAMIVLEGRQAEFCGCTFDGSGRIAIGWKATARAAEQGLVLGRLLLADCVFRGCRSAVRSEANAAQVIEAANVLHWRGGAFWLIGGSVGGEPLKLSLRQFTARDSGPLIEFADEPSTAVSLTVEADSAVIAPRAGLPVLMLHGARPDRVLDRLVWSGRGSLLAGESPFVALARQADEVIALDDESAAVAGLTRGRVVFAGAVDSSVEGQQVAQWQGPSTEEDPPGIAAGRLPQPTAPR